MKIEKTVNDLLGLNSVLNELSRRKVPFGITLAKNLKVLKVIAEEFDNSKKDLITELALLDENGNVLGKVIPGKEGEESPGRVENPQTFDQIDWVEKDGMAKILKQLNDLQIIKREIVVYPIDVDREYFNTSTRQKSTIREFVEQELEASMILFLDEMSMFKNLYEDEECESDCEPDCKSPTIELKAVPAKTAELKKV